MKKILFTGQMMLAYNQDRKRQTRRVCTGIKPGTPIESVPDWYKSNPPHRVGSVVRLASTWAVLPKFNSLKPSEIDTVWAGLFFWYDGWVDDDKQPMPKPFWAGKNRPGRFLPKTLYRYLPQARIVAAKLEPVQAISEADAIAEGVEPLFTHEDIHTPRYRAELDLKPMPYLNYLWHGHIGKSITGKQSDAWPHQSSSYSTAVGSFSSLWQKINGPLGYGWECNPLVWAYTLEPIRGDGQ